MLEQIQRGLRAFVGSTAWEELARTWVFRQGVCGALPFAPEVIGSHWDRRVQADVVAVSWRERTIMIGECTWSSDAVSRQMVRNLLDHTIPKTVVALPNDGQGWRIIPVIFARAGATPDAQSLLHDQNGMVVDLPILYADLSEDGG